jgi:protein-tyrosine phosphatase
MSYYYNLIKSGLLVLSDRTSDFIRYYLLLDNDLDADSKCKIINRRIFPKVSYYEQLNTFFSDPTYIVDSIYLGSAFNAGNIESLRNNNIGLIINMTNEITNHYESEIEYKRYPLYDNNSDSILEYLDLAYRDICKYRIDNPNKNILVHCFMGASRSASVVSYYLIKKYNITVDDAIIKLKSKRHIVNLTVKFYTELNKATTDII